MTIHRRFRSVSNASDNVVSVTAVLNAGVGESGVPVEGDVCAVCGPIPVSLQEWCSMP